MNKFHNTKGQRQQLHDDLPASPSLIEVARKYHLEDLPGASIPGSRITNVLKQLEAGTQLSNFTLEYLRKNSFIALFQYAKNEISFANFLTIAEPEQKQRRAVAEVKAKTEETARQLERKNFLARVQREQERAAAKKRAYENDPRTIAKREQNEFRSRDVL